MVGSHILLECVKKNEPIRAIYRRDESLNHIKSVFKKSFPRNTNLFKSIDESINSFGGSLQILFYYFFILNPSTRFF